MGDDLDSLAQVGTLALFVQHIPVDLAGSQVGVFVQVFIGKTLVMAQVQVGLGAVVSHKDLAVLQRAHRAGVHVDIRVQFLACHFQAAGLQQAAQAGGGNALAQPGNDAAGNKNILRCHDTSSLYT